MGLITLWLGNQMYFNLLDVVFRFYKIEREPMQLITN
jgi:hypothetical protein